MIVLAATSPAAAEQAGPIVGPVTAEEAMAAQQARVRELISQRCPVGAEADLIVVCARDAPLPRYRLPLAEPGAGRTQERAGDEQHAAMAADSSRCTIVGRNQSCGSIGIGIIITGGGIAAIQRRDQ